MNMLSTVTKTMSSRELLDLINDARVQNGEPEIRLNKFNEKIENELEGDHYTKSVVQNPNNTESVIYQLTNDQPMQPLAYDEKGVLRFKSNTIVQYLLDNGGVDMNKIALLDFSKEDRQQFAQLIGYSLRGYGTLSYVDNESYKTAEKIFNEGLSEDKARIAYLEGELKALRDALRVPMARLFEKHPDDLD